MAITGQAIHEIYVQRESTALPWDRISERSQEHYNMLAEKINAQYLAPLQGEIAQLQRENDAYKELLTRYKAFIECGPFMDQEEWLTKSLGLFRDTVALLKGEQKVKE